jgi:hypothetical protein
MFDHRRSRAVTVQVLELAEGSVIDWESLGRDALNWISEAEVAEFAHANGYLEEQE